nr:MAG TPA: hypothetical protein [Caudoviricetes sp.]
MISRSLGRKIPFFFHKICKVFSSEFTLYTILFVDILFL